MRSASLLACLAIACAVPADDLPTITRIRAEPAGASCAAGGRAVESGPDRDGDGVLADAEVESVDHLCAAPPIAALFRVDDVAPDARCVDGGLALVVGPDHDGDGALDDTEVDQREVVCHDATARAVIREDAEAPGRDCHLGGTTVAAGPDRDGDGALAAPEVEKRVHVCALAAANVLTRADVEPAGPSCPDGGTAIRAGLDDDLDGVLDDAEIDATHRVCDIVEIAPGNVIIDGTTTADQLARYARLRVVLGALTIRDVARVDLPALELVSGGVLVRGTTQHLAAPRLSRITGDLVVDAELSSLDLAALAEVTGQTYFSVDVDVSLPALATVGGDFRPLAVGSLHAARLAEVRGAMVIGGGPDTISLPALTRIGGLLDVFGAVAHLDLPQLADAGGLRLTYNAAGDVRLPALGLLRGSLEMRASDVTSLALPRLTTIREHVRIARSEDPEDGALRLTRLELPALEEAQVVSVEAPALTRLDLSRARRLQSVYLADLPQLTRLDLTALVSVIDMRVDRVGITSLDLPALETARAIALEGNPALAVLAIDRVSRLSSLGVTDHPRLATILARGIGGVETILASECPQLASFVTGATSVGTLALSGTALTDLQTFRTLRTLGRLSLIANPNLTSTTGLSEVTSAGEVYIASNPVLTSIGDLPKVTALTGSLALLRNPALTSLAGLRKVARVDGSLRIEGNAALKNVTGLGAIVLIARDLEIVNNAVLESLAGFTALRTVGVRLTLSANPRLPAAEQASFRARIGR